jgi:hypothetical protein
VLDDLDKELARRGHRFAATRMTLSTPIEIRVIPAKSLSV